MDKVVVGDILDKNMKCVNCGGDPYIIEGHEQDEKRNIIIKHYTKCCGIEIVIK